MTFSDLIQDIKKNYIINICVLILGPIFVWNFYRYTERKREENTMIINSSTEINKISVETVSFKRGLYCVNDSIYFRVENSSIGDIGDLEEFSTLSNEKKALRAIAPPYDIYKEKNNDSLFIVKDGVKFYLLVH